MDSSQNGGDWAAPAGKVNVGSRIPVSARGKKNGRGSARKEECGFSFRCEPHSSHRLIASPGMSLYLSQTVLRDGRAQMWDSITLHCDEESDGTLVIRVIVSNPDWEEPLQIACLRSRPHDADSLTPLACNLDHEELPG